MVSIAVQGKNLFFNTKTVEQFVGRANAAAMSKAGAFIQRRAKSSMRRRKKPSAAGSPPSAHARGNAGLKAILFAFNPDHQSVVIGPIISVAKGPPLGGKTQEFGGAATIREKLENLAPPEPSRKSRRGPKRILTPQQKAAMIRRKASMPAQAFVAGNKWVPIGRKKPLPGQPVRTRLASYPQRSFMGPALIAEVPKFPGLYAANTAGAG